MAQLQHDSDNEYFKNSRIMLGLAEHAQTHLFPGIFFRARPIQFKRLEDAWGSERFGAELERVLRSAFADSNLSEEAKSSIIKMASRQSPLPAESYLDAPPDLGFDLTLPDAAFVPIPGNERSDDLPPPLPFPWELSGSEQLEYQAKIAKHDALSSTDHQTSPPLHDESSATPALRLASTETPFDTHPSWLPSLAKPAPEWIHPTQSKPLASTDHPAQISFSPHPSWQPKLAQPAPNWTNAPAESSSESQAHEEFLPSILDIAPRSENPPILVPLPGLQTQNTAPAPESTPQIELAKDHLNETSQIAAAEQQVSKKPSPTPTRSIDSNAPNATIEHLSQGAQEPLPFSYRPAPPSSAPNDRLFDKQAQRITTNAPIKADYDKAVESIIARDAKSLDAAAPHGSTWPANSRWTIASLSANLDWSEGLNIAKRNGFSLDDPDGENITPLDRSISKKAWRATSSLLALGAKPSLSRSRNLVCALVNANATLNAILAALLRGADPNAPDAQGKLPIHHAAASGSKPFCEILIKHKARLDMPDAEGRLPRSIAKLHKHYDLSHYLQSEAIRHKNKSH